jgi:hypothetical protein
MKSKDENDGKTIDLNDLASRPGYQLTLVPREEPAEQATRFEMEKAEAEHRRWKDRILHVAAVIGVGLAFGLCVLVILREGSSSEGAKWAVPMLASIVAGIVGYLFGKSAK